MLARRLSRKLLGTNQAPRQLARAFAAGAPGFRCGSCGAGSAKWQGQCGACGAWGSVAPAAPPRFRQANALKKSNSVAWAAAESAESAAVLRMNDVQSTSAVAERIKLPERELVRALSGRFGWLQRWRLRG